MYILIYIQKSLGSLIFQLGSVGQGSMSHYLFVLFSLAIDDYGALEPSPMLMLTSSTLIKWLGGCCSFSPKQRISKQLPISSTCIQRFGEKSGTSWNIHIFSIILYIFFDFPQFFWFQCKIHVTCSTVWIRCASVFNALVPAKKSLDVDGLRHQKFRFLTNTMGQI